MRVFVLGTGRCGTTTFSKACQKIEGFTSSHERNTTYVRKEFGSLEYPDNHIEIDPRLSYHIFELKRKYKDAMFFHLVRERSSCIESLRKRKSLANYASFHYGWFNGDFNRAAELYYDNTTDMLNRMVGEDNILRLENIEQEFDRFCKMIGATNDTEQTTPILRQKFN